jgi:type I restriction enzyme S subunit
MWIAIPDNVTQVAIADYLDQEIGRQDALVAAKERLLELLAEKRRALITQAVTRGLNPEAPLCDSSIPWLGMIPAHWVTKRLKFLVNQIEQGWSPECHSTPASDDEWGVVKAGCCNGGIFNSDENKSLPLTLEPRPELEIQAGDILMSRASGSVDLIGSVAVVPDGCRPRLLLSDKTYRLHVDVNQATPNYLAIILGSAVGRIQIQEVVSGAAGLANNIAQSDIKEFVLPVPPLKEQRTIITHIDSETAKLDALRSATEKTIGLLKERREAMINAAVTGKIPFGEI